MTPIDCESRIERVVVYARGAVVTRRVALPEGLPAGPIEVQVKGVTALAEVGSLRAITAGDREVTALRPRLAVPSAPARSGRLKAEARAAMLERRQIEAEREHLAWRRAELGARAIEPTFSRLSRRADPAGRFADAIALSDLVGAEIERVDAKIRDLDEALAANQRRMEAMEVALAQGTHAEVHGEDAPRLDVLIRLGAADGGREGAGDMEVEYVVAAARWWPAYTARFTAQATRVAFTLDAFVAQASGEDWTRARIAVSTADLAEDARLPELRSLRIGRAQPAPRRGYRPPPIGLEAMFEGHDRAIAPAAIRGEIAPPEGTMQRSFLCRNGLWEAFDDLSRELECSVDHLINESMRMYTRQRSYAPRGAGAPPLARSGAPPIQTRAAALAAALPPAASSGPPQAGGFGPPGAAYGSSFGAAAPSAPPPPPMAAPSVGGGGGAPRASFSQNAPMPAPMAKERSASARPLGRRSDEAALFEETVDGLSESGDEAPSFVDAEEAAIEPGDAWLDFDALSLPDPEDRARRGRLCRGDAQGAIGQISSARHAIEMLAAPAEARDPLETRGRFDHRYDAEGTADVPSSGRPHRIAIASAEAPASPRFISVPREIPEVYREVEIKNPFASPLLSGPVEVFIDGALLTTSSLSFVDKSGLFYLGLGVEDRIRVARNVRVQEGSAGLLGGSTTVEHAITIDVASSLGQKVAVEVLDRVPVTDDKDIDVKVLYARPEPSTYTQADRGAPVRRGLRFRVEVPPGDKQRIELAYRVTLPAKNELVGGNRRE